MGTLTTLDKLMPDANWYFEDAYQTNSHPKAYAYTWPNPAFPHQVAIHSDRIKQCTLLPSIRRWVERNLSETVIYSVIDKSYRIYWGEDWDWDHSRERHNAWFVFYFEDEHSAAMFKLAFADHVTEVADYHPYQKDQNEKTSIRKKD